MNPIADGSEATAFVIGNVLGKGRGLIAIKPIRQGTTVLRDPAIKLDENDRDYLDNSIKLGDG